ncbi:MAG: ATP-binding cassette domain-containing protein [Pseudomonadota bacterium]
MIILRQLGLRRGSKLLLKDVDVTIQPGQRLALIGANGSGKSSLLALLMGQLMADNGDIEGLASLRLAHMAQEVHASSLPAVEFVWRGDSELAALRDTLQDLETREEFEEAAVIHGKLADLDGYSAERRSQRLLLGLGFSESDTDRPVDSFSGGWRIRLNLARALMTPSDVLLLDEPTNHLDLDATLWLQQWLQLYPGTLLMISHDRDFIDATCERVLHLEHQRLSSYKGNYSEFERLRALRLRDQQATYEKQQRRVAEIDSFVRRFRYKASKARQAQSRLKELERMQDLAPAHVDSPFDFSFSAPGRSSDPLMRLDNAELGYRDATVLSQVEVQLRPGSRVGLLGRNGAGKSTLMKSLVGDLELLSGDRACGEHCRIGYFNQQQLEALDLQASAFLHIQRLNPDAREQDILNFLGGFNFRGDDAKCPIAPFSGGEKARLALAILVWQRPNLLVLDEPTNHLDLDMRHALEIALQAYEGALILVSHDRHLLRNTVDELLLVHNGRVDTYQEDLNAYERWVLSNFKHAEQAKADNPPDESRKEKRQRSAAKRDQLRPLQQKLKELEKAMADAEATRTELQQRLTDSELYSQERKSELSLLMRQEAELNQKLSGLEEQWLEQQTALEAITAEAADDGLDTSVS